MWHAVFIAAAVVALLALDAEARPVSLLTYQQLLDKSDLVVIATPTSPTTDTKEHFPLPGLTAVGQNGKVTAMTCIGVETSFGVSAVLKGDKSVRQLILHHGRMERRNEPTVNGPTLVEFDQMDKNMSGSFLMFLVREADGRYAPTGDQTDPGIKAITKLRFGEPIPPRR